MSYYKRRIILSILLSLVLTLLVSAQQADDNTYTFEFQGIELVDALKEISNSSATDLVFDPEIVGSSVVYKRIRNQPIDSILEEVLDGTGLDFIILSSGTYVVIRSTRRAERYGTFSGKITDQRTGEPLAGATIMLADASGGVSSNPSGHFSMGKIVSGTYDIIFSYVGYEPVKKTITIPADGSQSEEVQLRPKRVDVTPIVVSAHQPVKPVLSGNEFRGESIDHWDGGHTSGDAIRNLSLFTGVQYGLPLSDVHLQGGQSSDHRFFLDGMPVYQPYSFGQLYSSFSPYALGRMSVEKAGFGVPSGSHIAGRVNLTHDIANISGESAVLQADPVNTNARFTLGGRDSRFRLMGAVRSSFWDLYQDPVLSSTVEEWDLVDPLTYNLLVEESDDIPIFETAANQTDIRYHDLHLAGEVKIDLYRELSFSMYQGSNRVETDMLAQGTQSPFEDRMFSRDSYEWNNLMAQVSYNWMATPRLDVEIQGGYSSNRLDHSYAMLSSGGIGKLVDESQIGQPDEIRLLQSGIGSEPTQSDGNEIEHFKLKGDIAYSVSPSLTIRSGLQAEYIESRFDLAGLFYLPAGSEQQSAIYSTYVDGQWSMGAGFRVTAGSRFTSFGSSGLLYPEPRASVQYDRDDTALGYWSVKLSGGVYRQFINQFSITNVGPSSLVPDFTVWSHDNDLEKPVSYHNALELMIQPSERTTITAEGYLKYQPAGYITSYERLLFRSETGQTGFDTFAEKTEMRSYGTGFRFSHSMLQSRLQVLLGYDLSISNVRYESQFGRMLSAPWNDPHRIQGRILARILPNTTLVAKWRSTLGRKWAFRQSYYDFLVFHDVTSAGSFNFLTPESDRLPDFHQLDLSFIYKPSIAGLQTELRVDFINVLGRRNVIDQTLVPVQGGTSFEKFEIRERTLPSFNPSVSIQIGI